MDRTITCIHGLLYAVVSLFIVLFLWIFFSLTPRIYSQHYEQWIEPQIKAHCIDQAKSDGNPCDVTVTPLQDGRYRISAKPLPGHILTMEFIFPKETAPTEMMVRRGHDILGGPSISDLDINLKENPTNNKITIEGNPNWFTDRVFHPITLSETNRVTLILSSHQASAPPNAQLVIDEIGFRTSEPIPTITKIATWFVGIYQKHKTLLIVTCCLILFSFTLLGCNASRHSRDLMLKFSLAFKSQSLLFILSLGLALLTTQLYLHFSPETYQDLRTMYLSGSLLEAPRSNLNYGIHMAANILQGHGPLLSPGTPPWHRMPGYGVLLALGNIFAGNPHNLLQLSMNSILFQVIITAFSIAFFFGSARKIMPSVVAGLLCIYFMLLPNQLYYLQIESIMPGVVLLNLGLACLYLNARKKTPNELPPLIYHLLFHGGFALWFFIRPDVVIGWFVVSALLYLRKRDTWKYLLIPVSYYLLIGLGWALFKYPFTHEFSMSTNSVGASFMVGLWEIPNKFIWEIADDSYFKWINENISAHPFSKAANDYAIQEVIRFYFTYPFYIVSLVWHKFIQYASYFSASFYLSFATIILLLSTMAASFLMRYKDVQTLLLGWPVLFNLTVFFLTYSSVGRFYAVPTISLVAATIPLLADHKFYCQLNLHKRIVVGIILLAGLIYFCGQPLDDLMIHADSFRYWSPLLNPSDSSLAIIK